MIAVLGHLGVPALDVQDACGIGELGADDICNALRMLIGRVFALQDALVVGHGGICSRG